MSDLVDLHIHSNKSSDGDLSPAEVVDEAKEAGFRAISITDHDTVAAYPEAVDLGRKAGVEVIPSIELTTLFKGREFHLLLPFLECDNPVMADILAAQTRFRMDEAFQRVEKLRSLGLDITWDEVREKSNGVPPLGVKIAHILLAKPENRAHPGLESFYRTEKGVSGAYLFYKEFFAEGKAAHVPKTFIDLIEVLRTTAGAVGVPVLSHPGAYFQQADREDVKMLKKNGLAGLEVHTFYHTPEQVAFYAKLAEEFDLVPTAGSDFHGRIKPHVAFGSITEGRYWMVERLRERKGKTR